MGIQKKTLAYSKNNNMEYNGILYRQHTYLCLLDLQNIKNLLSRNDEFFVDEETYLSTYEGHTIFSIFLQKPQVFETILD